MPGSPGVQPDDRGVGVAPVGVEHVFEGHGGRVVDFGAGAGVGEERLGYERRGPDHDVGGGQALGAAKGDEVGGAGAGADEGDHGCLSDGATMTVAR